MERLHPNKCLPNRRQVAFALRGLLVLCLAGCSNQQMSASNPFMAPDRVPPPATRPIAPGTAAPYYPGDPVPAAQITPPSPQVVAQAQPPVVPTATLPVSAAPIQATPQPLAFSNERTVAIPNDTGDLRFALPAPPVAQQVASAPAPAPAPEVIPAAYNQPIAQQQALAASLVPTATADANSSGPWRSPQVPNSTSPVTQAQFIQPQPQLGQPPPQQSPPIAAPMPVQLRAIPAPSAVPMTAPALAPAAAPVEPTMMPPPRMRFPSLTSPSTWFTPQPAAPANQQLIGYMVPGPNGTSQMVSVEQMQAMAGGAAQQPAAIANSDGFRPRGSTTK